MAPHSSVAPMAQGPNVMSNNEMEMAVKEMEAESRNAKKNLRQRKLKKMKEIALEWGSETSCHGVSHIVDASSMLTVIIWGAILICCMAGFIFLFQYSLREYLANEKLVGIEMNLKEIDFPSVTICNTNPYKRSNIQKTQELDALLTVYVQAQKGDGIM